MKPNKIRKGWKCILHLPRILKNKSVYKQRIAISHSMTLVSDKCDSGWSKVWGIAFGHHHWNSSYRFAFRNKDGKFILGYYAYVDGVSPQDNKAFKGSFNMSTNIQAGDLMEMQIERVSNSFIKMSVRHEYSGEFRSSLIPAPRKYKWVNWLITELYPNLKCKQKQVTTFQFLRS